MHAAADWKDHDRRRLVVAQAEGPPELGDALVASLPPGAAVAVAWLDARLGPGEAGSATAGTALHAAARALVDEEDVAAGATPIDIDGALTHAWRCGGLSVAVAVAVGTPLSAASAESWRALSRRLVDATLRAAGADARIASLQKSERLQQALYEIANLAGAEQEMREVLARIHAVVGTLMSAENFYIVLYDDVRETLRFLYFADQRDPWVAEPEVALAIADLHNSLTVALLRHGRPLLGPSADIRGKLGVPRDLDHGPDAAAWMGVPMRRDSRVSGAIVVQSYDPSVRYTEEDRALLEFVAQHILTALDRKHAQAELERRVGERTRELQRANDVLQAEILERQRAETLQRALFRISEMSISAGSIERFYADLHAIVGGLLYARNFYIAMLTGDGSRLEFPYSVDEADYVRHPRRAGRGLSEFVIRTGVACLVDRDGIDALEDSGEVRSMGAKAYCWLGVPLSRDRTVVGVIAVQSYSPEIGFTTRDQDLLTFVAQHIDGALARKRSQEYMKAAHAELEYRVDTRTRELEDANRELREQIGERIRAEQRLTHQARHDPLTGLPNRIHLLERIDAAIRTMVSDGGAPFAVLFLDLDRFKLVNDSVGHAAGDEMLVETGRRIVRVMAGRGTVARLGGDEFVLMLSAVDDLAAAERTAAEILAALGEPMWVAGRELFPSASIGIALWQPRYRSGDELLRDADAAMYRAKSSGRDRSEVFDERMRAEASRLLDLEADLRRAIFSDGFEPWFQPIVRLSDGAVVGHEALLRWNHELHGALPPADFIGVGEDTGLIEQVDWLLYRHVFRWLARQPEGYVSINVSPRHFRSDDFAERLLRLLEDAGADPSRLRIEITEVALLDDAPRTLRMLRQLGERGVVAMLDDFGTGFSALSYLHRFPIKSLKIDQSFVAGLDGDTHAESLALVRAILALAGTLGIDTVGEGIESAQQRDLLCQLGCKYGQGYLFGRPTAASPSRGAESDGDGKRPRPGPPIAAAAAHPAQRTAG